MSKSTDRDLDADEETVEVTVENVGGIDSCSVTFGPGITVLTGRNATNRTSFLTSVAGALGGNAATLKSDADDGSVTLRIGDETYTRRYTRRGKTVHSDGEPYVDDADLVDLFGCLLEDNPARQAVKRGDDLREIIMRPVDKVDIKQEIRDRERERDRVESRLSEIERRREDLPRLQERRVALTEEIDEIEAEIGTVSAVIEEYDVDGEEAEREEQLIGELEELQAERRRLRSEIETQKTSLNQLHEQRAEAETELEDLTVPDEELTDLEGEIDRLKGHRRALADTVNDLSAIVGFNEDVISESIDLPGLNAEREVTEALDPVSESVTCWTCGSSVMRGDVEDRLADLRSIVEEKREERKRIKAKIDDLKERRAELRSLVDRKADLESDVEKMTREIERREARVEELKAEAEQVRSEIADLEERVAETEELRETELVEKHERLSDLQYELGQQEQELASVEDSIAELTEMADERDQLQEQRDQLREEITQLRSRIVNLERSAVEQFNEHMDEVLNLLEYRNIARVWIERKTADEPQEGSTFELHVVRELQDGTVYEDVVTNLSESEREVIGLVVALAGYLVHDVYEQIPVMLLDSMEAIDADRISALVEYFGDYAPYLLVALLPEDEQALPETYERLPAEAFGD